jgi:hypothetical protein
VKVTGDAGAAVEVKVGVQPSTRRHFLLTEDGRRIVPLPDAMAAALGASAESYRVDRIFEIADFEARAVSVRQREKDVETVTALVAEARPRAGRRVQMPEWRFEAPYDTPAEKRLGAPALRLALEGNARRQVLLVGRAAPGQPQLLCAKLEDNAAVFLIEARELREWMTPRATLADTRPADFDPALVTGFTVSAGGRTITLHRLDGLGDETRWEIPVAPGSTATKRREADARLVGRFLAGLSQLRATRRPRAGRRRDGPDRRARIRS